MRQHFAEGSLFLRLVHSAVLDQHLQDPGSVVPEADDPDPVVHHDLVIDELARLRYPINMLVVRTSDHIINSLSPVLRVIATAPERQDVASRIDRRPRQCLLECGFEDAHGQDWTALDGGRRHDRAWTREHPSSVAPSVVGRQSGG